MLCVATILIAYKTLFKISLPTIIMIPVVGTVYTDILK